jgi:hypothetical protein
MKKNILDQLKIKLLTNNIPVFCYSKIMDYYGLLYTNKYVVF